MINASRVGTEAFGADVLLQIERIHVGIHSGNVVHLGLGVGELRFGVGEFGLGLGALISKLGSAVFPLRQTVGIFSLAAFELSAALIELRLALGKLRRSGIERGLTAREALVGRSLLGSKFLLARRKLLRHARGLRIDLSDARLKLSNARFNFSYLGFKLRLLLLELRQRLLSLSKLLFKSCLLRLELRFRFPISRVGRIKRVDLRLQTRDCRVQPVNRLLRLINASRNLRKAIIYLTKALLRFGELIVQHFARLQSGVILRPALVNRRLRPSQRRLCLRTLVGEFSHARIILGATARQPRFTLSNGRLRRFKLNGRRIELRLRIVERRLAIVELRERIDLLLLVFRTLFIERSLGVGLQAFDARRLQIVGDRVDAIGHFVDFRLVGIACPWQVARTIDRDERFGNGVIVSEGRIGNEHEARKTAASKRRRTHVSRARVIRRIHEADHRELALGEAVVQVLRALDKAHLVADMHIGLPHRVRRKQALVAFRGPGAALQDRPVQIRTVARLHGEAIVARARLGSVNIKRLEAQRILHAIQF